MANFTKLEIGTEVFSTQDGVGKIAELNAFSESDGVKVVFNGNRAFWHTANGKLLERDTHPTLFLSLQHAIDYFQSVTKPVNLKVDFNDYKVGDEVWDSWSHKWVRINAIKSDSEYSIRLIDGQCCNLQGDYCTNNNLPPRYFPNQFLIPQEAYVRPAPPPPNLKIDTMVWVSLNDGIWVTRHFAGWNGDRMKCWNDGKTSFTGEKTTSWKIYSLTDPN